MVGYGYKSALIFYGEGKGTGNITIKRYVNEILEPYVLPTYLKHRARGDDFLYKQDNDGGHGFRSKKKDSIVKKWFREHPIELYCNTPNSPDFVPLENV